MAQRDWKAAALLSIGFSAGMAYTVACGDKNPMDAHASEDDSGEHSDGYADTENGETGTEDGETGTEGSDSDTEESETEDTKPPSPTTKSRAVVEIYFGLESSGSRYRCGHTNNEFELTSETFDVAAMQDACCPEGFTAVGWSSNTGYDYWPLVCLEDA